MSKANTGHKFITGFYSAREKIVTQTQIPEVGRHNTCKLVDRKQIRVHIQIDKWVKLGLGSSVSHRSKGGEGVNIPVGASLSPAKVLAKTWAPGVGRRRSRSCPHERERARRAHAACRGEN